MANIPLISSAIGAGLGLGTSIWGGIKAGSANKKMRELEKNRPTYSRPDEIKQYLEMAKSGARGAMPGQTQMEQNVQQSTQGALSSLQESGELDAGAIQKLYQSEVGAYNNLAMQQGQYYQSQQDRLSQAFQQSAKYADQEFEYNVNAPWQRQYNRAIGKYEAGQQMVNQGLSNITGSASSYAGMKMATNPQYNMGYNTGNNSYSGYQMQPLDLGQSSQIDTSSFRSTPNF
jgi:hypothetical protein